MQLPDWSEARTGRRGEETAHPTAHRARCSRKLTRYGGTYHTRHGEQASVRQKDCTPAPRGDRARQRRRTRATHGARRQLPG